MHSAFLRHKRRQCEAESLIRELRKCGLSGKSKAAAENVPGLGVDVRTVLQELLDNEAVYIHRKTYLLRQPFFISHDYPFLHTRVKDLVGSITRLQNSVLIGGMLPKHSADHARPPRLEGFYSATG